MKKTASLAVILSLTQMYLGQDLVYTASPGFLTHNQHQDVTLSWRVSSSGADHRFWRIYLYQENKCLIRMFSGAVVSCDGTRRGVLSVNDTHVDYIVQNTSSDDAGRYSCAISTEPTFYNDSNAVLYIFDTPDTPLLSPSEANHEGSQFTLRCKTDSTSLLAANRPQVNMMYIWLNNSEELDPGDLPERYSITSSEDPANAVNDLLVITSLSRHDAGSYTCKAHEDGSDLQSPPSNSYDLEPLFAPYNVQVNQSAEIIEYERLGPVLCSAVCNPPCTYSWYKGGAQVSPYATLMIHNVTRDDHGLYECRPDNRIPGGQTAHFDLTIFYGPSVDSFEDITPAGPINQNDDVTVSCQTDSRPMPVISLIRPSGDTLQSSSISSTLEHTLTDIDCLDSGVYRCVAYNSRTERNDHKPLSIRVQCPPRKHLTSDVKVGATEGDTVMVSVIAIASPRPTFMWFFNGTQLTVQHNITTSYSRGLVPAVYVNSTLAIRYVTQGDFGNYSVTASNPLGVMEDVVFLLIPAGPPVAPSQLMASHSNAVSITMQWTSGWNIGGQQVFTLMYRRSDSDDTYTKITDIGDPGQGATVRAKVRNLTSDSSYDFIVVAENRYGSTQSQLASASTTAQPDLGTKNDGVLSIVISGNMATITWSLHSYSGPITHVDVNSCVSDSAYCILTSVAPSVSTVEVAVPEGGPSYTFEFLMYDGEDFILGVKCVIKVDPAQPVGTIVGVVIAILLLAVVATGIGVIARRRSRGGDDKKKTEAWVSNAKRDDSSVPVVHYENVCPRGKSDLLPQSDLGRTQPEVDVYEDIGESDEATAPAENEYELPRRSQISSDMSTTHYEVLRPVNNISGTTDKAANRVELSDGL